jgi:hypothetical protein
MHKGMIEWEHSPESGLVVRINPGMPELFNGEACRHARAMRKEMLLTLRGLIDLAVRGMEEKEKKAGEKATKIPVE